MLIVTIAFIVFAFCCLHIAYLFWASPDGILRKLLIADRLAMAWCTGIWAWVYPLDKYEDWMVYGLVTIIPIAAATFCLQSYLAREHWRAVARRKNKPTKPDCS